MNGNLHLNAARGRFYTIYGGAYTAKPEGYFGVRLAPEVKKPADVVIPIRDFSVPKDKDLFDGMSKVLDAMIAGKAVYVGCMAGRGRTGLFLAALVRLWGEEFPVKYVRKHYFSHAVETQEQFDYVGMLEFPLRLRVKVALAKAVGYLPFRMSLTNEP